MVSHKLCLAVLCSVQMLWYAGFCSVLTKTGSSLPSPSIPLQTDHHEGVLLPLPQSISYKYNSLSRHIGDLRFIGKRKHITMVCGLASWSNLSCSFSITGLTPKILEVADSREE